MQTRIDYMIPNIYNGDYKRLLIFPLLLITISIIFIPNIKLGVDFKGGTLVRLTLQDKVDSDQIQKQLESEGLNAKVRTYQLPSGATVAEIDIEQSEDLLHAEDLKNKFNDIFLQVSRIETEANGTISDKRRDLFILADQMFKLASLEKKARRKHNINVLNKEFGSAYSKVYENYRNIISKPIEKHVKYSSLSVQTVSPLLKGRFIEQAAQASFVSLILTTILVFIFFRAFIPSIAVVIATLSDVIIALGAMGLFGIPFTLPALAALFMLSGFSLDTDMLLRTRVLKRSGDPREKAYDAMKTGVTMSITAIVAFSVLFIISLYTRIPTYYEISAIAIAGIFGDIFAAWFLNAVILLMYIERKEAKHK